MRSPLGYLCCLTLCLAFEATAQEPVDFVRDIQPIFTTRCLNCHGPVRQESDYRVDVREIAMGGKAEHPVVIKPGEAQASLLVQLIAGQIDGQIMPAKGERLSKVEIDLIERWINAGAQWPDSANRAAENKLDWWSLRPIERPNLPEASSGYARHSAIDAFIGAQLDQHHFAPAPIATRTQLVRRLYFDLIGLPPSPTEVAEFVTNEAPDAYHRLVDRLLASPRYGERWARHWMDTAHFAETHGHDQDRIREHAWPYRDYLVQAFNADDSYSNFIREQLAADVFSSDPAKIPALGFLAAGPWDESTLRDIREDTIDREIGRYVDRDDMLTTVMSNLASLTVQCARCHDHKFDPITQRDYYALQAVFAGVERANRSYDLDATTAATRAQLKQRRKQLAQPSKELRGELLGSDMQRQLRDWEAKFSSQVQPWRVLLISTARSSDGSTLTAQPDDSVLASGKRPERDTYELSGQAPLDSITGLRIEVLTDDSLPHRGPGRQDNGNLHLSEIELIVGEGRPVALRNPQADFDQVDWGIARALDGRDDTAWGIYPKVGQAHEAVFECVQPIALAGNQPITVKLKQLHGAGHLIGRVRISLTGAAPPLRTVGLPADVAGILAKVDQERSDEERFQLALYWQRQEVARQIAELPAQPRVYAAAADFEPDGSLKPPPGPRPIHILARGDIRTPKELVTPGSLACIQSVPAAFTIDLAGPESARRAALAQWLTDTRNPLLWRSIVNRVWQYHFGRGLVDTLNDFGRLGAQPSHPELLNWLAADFRDSDQSLKRLHRSMVLSATYQQSSQMRLALVNGHVQERHDEARTLDSDNRLLWRMNRNRLDAECVRDSVLVCSGQCDLRMGGPSDRQFDLKPGRHVTPIVDYSLFDLDSPLGQRRGIYRFLFRTLPDPFMEALDCPAGDQITPTRVNSVTVQQVLAMWNDAFVLRQAEHMATRLEREAVGTADRVRLALQLGLGREATDQELKSYVEYADQFGLANFCRLVFNTNEFMFVD